MTIKLKNIVQLSTECDSCCPVCDRDAFPFSLAEANGYTEACPEHAEDLIKLEMAEGTIVPVAAACPRCAGWTSFGGMSHRTTNKCDCH